MKQNMEDFFNYYNSQKLVVNNNDKNNNVAVIVEPRNHKYLIPIIKNVMINLGNNWNLHIFGSDDNYESLTNNILGTFKFTNLQIENLNQTSYSLLLESLFFWNNINEEHIIIFQTDSFINNTDFNISSKYGFIGASYSFGITDKNNEFIDLISPVGYNYNINGGFSFRLRSVMIDCIKNVTVNDIIKFREKNKYDISNFINKYLLMEDVYFTNAMVLLGYKLPPLELCDFFCSQQTINYNSFGIHGFNKSYAGFNKNDLEYFFTIKK